MDNVLAVTVSPEAKQIYGEHVWKDTLNRLLRAREDSGYSMPEASVHLPFDESILKRVVEVCAPLGKEDTSAVIILGIGGSNLGTKAVYEALREEDTPPFFFLDTCHTALFEEFKQFLNHRDAKKAVFFFVSKSGTTTETVVLRDWVREYLESKSWLVPERWISITKGGELTIPENVGGRYSVFSAAHLAPLYFLLGETGLQNLVTGARELLQNLAFSTVSAEVLFGAHENGFAVHDTFFFHPRLRVVGDWYRQLAAESLGKDEKGLLPTTSVGTVDLHSVAQLYFGGRKNILTSFVTVHESGGKEFDAITEGVLRSYEKAGLPYLHWTLNALDPKTLGAFLQAKMLEVMLFASLLGVNAFDQPAVELYKDEVKKILSNNS